MMKQCTICKEDKELTEFYKNKRTLDGHEGQCKSCRNRKQRKRYAEDPEYKDRKARYRQENKFNNKEWRLKNKEHLKKKRKEYYLNNKERENEYNREYRKNNKDYFREHYLNNREHYNEQSRKYYRDNKVDGYAVYYLPEHHYAGMTNNIQSRMTQHRRSGKIVEGVEIVGIYKTSVEAHLVETMLHMMGYHGFHYRG